jgi:hypothetical protein
MTRHAELVGRAVESTVIGAPVPPRHLDTLLDPPTVDAALEALDAVTAIVGTPRPSGRTPQAQQLFDTLAARHR